MDYTIYLIENTVNHKLYVGLTENSVQKRWQRHRSNAARPDLAHFHLYRAMTKYGLDAFDFMELTWASTREEANRLEMEWIERFDSFDNGYNLTRGGDGVAGVAGETHAMAKETDEEAIQLMREWHLSGQSVRSFCAEKGMHPRRLNNWLNGRHRADLGKKYRDRFNEEPRDRFRGTLTDEEVIEVINEYRTTRKTLKQISKERDISYSNISCWNSGHLRPHLQEEFAEPVRATESGVTDEEVVNVINRYRRGGITQKELAAELDVSSRLVSAWHTGKQRPHLQDRMM